MKTISVTNSGGSKNYTTRSRIRTSRERRRGSPNRRQLFYGFFSGYKSINTGTSSNFLDSKCRSRNIVL